jgi:hypothetical protein
MIGAENGNEWGEFLHKKGERFYDFAKIKKGNRGTDYENSWSG